MTNYCVVAGVLKPQMRFAKTYTGHDIVNFLLECPRDNKSAKRDLIRCTALGTAAKKVAEEFRPGDLMTVRGRLQLKNYLNREGMECTAYEVSVRKVEAGEHEEL